MSLKFKFDNNKTKEKISIVFFYSTGSVASCRTNLPQQKNHILRTQQQNDEIDLEVSLRTTICNGWSQRRDRLASRRMSHVLRTQQQSNAIDLNNDS